MNQEQDRSLIEQELEYQQRRPLPSVVVVPSFSAAIFYVALGFAPIRVETDDAGRNTWVFPAAIRDVRDRYHDAKDVLEEVKRRSRGAAK